MPPWPATSRTRHRRARVAARTVVHIRRRARAGGRAHRARPERVPGTKAPEDPRPRVPGEGDPGARHNRRPEEELAFLRHAIAHALERDLPVKPPAGSGGLSDACFDGRPLRRGARRTRRAASDRGGGIGDRRGGLYGLSETSYALAMTGTLGRGTRSGLRDSRGAAPGG